MPCSAPSRPRQGLKPSTHADGQSLRKGGFLGTPHRRLEAPSQLALEPGHRRAPGAPGGVSVCSWVGGARSSSPRTPASRAPAARQLCAPVEPRGHRQTAGWAAGDPGGPCSALGPGERRTPGSEAVRVCFPPTPPAELSPGAGSPGFPRQPRPPPWVHGPPLPAAGVSLRAPGMRRAGAARQDTALLTPRGAGAPARTPDARSPGERAAPRGAAGLGAPDWRPDPAPGAPRWPLAGSGEGVPLFATLRKAPFRPARHPRTHQHQGAGRVAHLSPKSC